MSPNQKVGGSISLANFQCKTVNQLGKLHADVDTLSRLPVFCDGGGLGKELPASKKTGKDIPKMCAVQEISQFPLVKGDR